MSSSSSSSSSSASMIAAPSSALRCQEVTNANNGSIIHNGEHNNSMASAADSTASGNAKTTTKTTSAASTTTDMTRRMMCGGLAGMIAKTATNPLERLKMLSQTGETGGSKSTVGLLRTIVRREGLVRGLWAGNGTNLLRVFPAKAIVFSSNDFYKQVLLSESSIVVHVALDENKSNSTQVAAPALPGHWAFVAGGMSGMTASFFTYPLDFCRGRISGKLGTAAGSSSTGTALHIATTKKQYRGILSTLVLTIKDEGLLAVYKGITPTLLGAMPYEGIKFGTVGVLEVLYPLQQDDDDRQQHRAFRKMCFGGVGGIMAGLATYPNDTVRRLLQLQGSRGTHTRYDNGYWDCVHQVYNRYGVGRFYRGISINMLRMAPNTAIQFYSYEVLKQMTEQYS